MEKYCISIDWLQVCCTCNEIIEGEYNTANYTLNVSLTSTQTAMFQDLHKVTIRGIEVANIQSKPRSPKLNSKLVLIKIDNRVLYSTKYIELLYEIMGALKCKYKGITRLDLCYDCNKYTNGRSPSRFINQFISKEAGTLGYVYRKGSDKFAAYGSKSRTSNAKITSIRFGSEKSKIGAYIYDKTIELQEVKDKPWIREMWKKNGLVSNEKTHVFRSEISIKSQGMDILNMSTGELFRLSPQYLEHYDRIVKLFHFYAKKYFDFRINTGQSLKENYKHLYLFECDCDITCKPIYISKSADTGRMEKICYNKLQRLTETYTDQAESVRNALVCAMDFLQHLSGLKLGISEREHYKRYLDTLKGHYFTDWHDLAYLAVIEESRKARIELDAEMVYRELQNAPAEVFAES
jgi:hypothetical protein